MNQILYGVAGTGKTFYTKKWAVEVIENNLIENNFFEEIEKPDVQKIQEKYEFYKKNDQIIFVTFHPNFSYQEFVEGITAKTLPNGQISYFVKDGIFKFIAQKANFEFQQHHQNQTTETQTTKAKNFVLIIDEINRGNVAKIFGELLTLIEENKRLGNPDAQMVVLPYSQETFGVSPNLHIIATMNGADRSIASLDLALRRRFDFVEMLPNAQLLEGKTIENISLKALLQKINQRICFFLGENYQIGHSYFLAKCDNWEDLVDIFLYKIIPLLKEYFFEDMQKVHLILQNKNPNISFFRKAVFNPKKLFNTESTEFEDIFLEEKFLYQLLSKKEILANVEIIKGII